MITIPVWLLPSCMVALSVGSSIAYALAHDWKMAGYWISAASLTACITYL